MVNFDMKKRLKVAVMDTAKVFAWVAVGYIAYAIMTKVITWML